MDILPLPTRKKPGPKTNKGKDPVHCLRVPEKEWEAWRKAAQREGTTIARLIRKTMNRSVARKK